MAVSLSSVAIQEKNKLAADSVFCVALKITIPGITDPVRVVDNSENITWQGETWVAFEFKINEITDATGEVPRVDISISNISRVMEVYLDAYDSYIKTNGYSPIVVNIYVINTLAIANKSATITRVGSTAMVACTAHRFSSGQDVYIAGAEQSEYNGLHEVTVTGVDAFTYTVVGTPTTPATGTITAHLATPEVEHIFELKQPKAGPVWAVLTLGASNPYTRRFPQNRILKNRCRYKFKGSDGRCGYSGVVTTCNHTLAACRALSNSVRFGGAPGVGSSGFEVD